LKRFAGLVIILIFIAMRALQFIFCMSLSVLTQAQILPQIGARSIGLGSTGLTQNDIYAMQNNPGAFGALDQSQIAITYQNRFLIPELSNQSLVAGWHTKSIGNFGLSVQHYGFNLYR